MDKDSKTYEISYLLTPLVPEDKVAESVALLRKFIEDNGGLIMNENMPKTQKLSYPIKKFQSAYFGWFRFSTVPESVLKIKGIFANNINIIRSLVTEAGKENLPQFSLRRSSESKKGETLEGKEEKAEIKPEQIDQKLDEILKEASV